MGIDTSINLFQKLHERTRTSRLGSNFQWYQTASTDLNTDPITPLDASKHPNNGNEYWPSCQTSLYPGYQHPLALRLSSTSYYRAPSHYQTILEKIQHQSTSFHDLHPRTPHPGCSFQPLHNSAVKPLATAPAVNKRQLIRSGVKMKKVAQCLAMILRQPTQIDHGPDLG